MNSVAIKICSLEVTWYSLFILTGVIIGYILILKEAKRHNIDEKFVNDSVFWCVIFGILGARVYYVLFNLDYYLSYPTEIIKIWNGGLAIHGGIIFGLLVFIYYCRKYKINLLKYLDIIVPSLVLAQALGRWGNFFNGEAHGPVVALEFLQKLHLPKFIIDGMYINGNYYHPTFLYESFFCLLCFIILIILRRNKDIKTGTLTGIYLVWYGILRFLIESLRTDSLMLWNIKMAQLVSIIMNLIGVIIIIISIKNKSLYNERNALDEKR